jgi:hypothetical protein
MTIMSSAGRLTEVEENVGIVVDGDSGKDGNGSRDEGRRKRGRKGRGWRRAWLGP